MSALHPSVFYESTWTGIPPAALPTAMVWRGSVMSGGDVRVLERERGDLRGGGGVPEGPRVAPLASVTSAV